MRKKIGLLILGALLAISVCMMFACAPKVSIEIESELSMSVYDTKVLEPKVSGYDGELTYTSSDPTVVEADGATLRAFKAGEAVITIAAGEVSVQVNVTVSEATVSPAISAPSEVRVVIGEKAEFKPVIKLGDKTVDGTLSVKVEDETVVGYANGEITALKIGTTSVTVSGKYFNSNLRPITVNVIVLDDLVVTPSTTEVKLDTYVPSGSEEYKTNETVTITVEEKGELVETPAITWNSEDEKVAVVENGVITAVGEGSTKVTAEYKSVVVTVNVTVTKTMLAAKEYAGEYDLNADDADEKWLTFNFGNEIELDDVVKVRDVTDEEKAELTFKKENGKILLDKETVIEGERIIVLENELFGVEYEALFATKLIYDKQDMIEMMSLATEGYEVYPGVAPAPAAGDPAFYTGADGYFVLKADIDMEGDIFRLTYLDNTAYPGFTGTFDGRGHTVSNVGGANDGNCRSGMFGLLKTGGVIKNTAFVNCWGANYTTDTGTRVEGKHNVLVGGMYGGTIENVYLYVTRDTGMSQPWGTGPLVGQYSSGTIDNVFVVVRDLTRNIVADGTNMPGSIIGQFVGNGGTEAVRSVTNAYGINDLYKAVGVGTSLDDASSVAKWNTYEELFVAVKAEDFAYDFTPFEKSEYWTMIDGVPVFSSALEIFKKETDVSLEDIPGGAEAGKEYVISNTSAYQMLFAYELKEAVDGVTVKNGKLSVGVNATNGAVFTIVARNLFNSSVMVQKNYTVLNIVTGAAHTDFDLSTAAEHYDIEMNEEVVPVSVSVEGGATLSESNYSATGKVLSVTAAGVEEILGGKKYGDFKLIVTTDGARSYSVDISVVTKIIYNKQDAQEMMRIATKGYTVCTDARSQITDADQPDFYSGADGYFILANDVDMQGEIIRFTLRGGSGGNPGFIGIFDGRGHKISNIGSDKYPLDGGGTGFLGNNSSGIFGNITGIVRNVAFVNVYAGMDTVSGKRTPHDFASAAPDSEQIARSSALAWMIGANGLVENVYVSYYVKDAGFPTAAIPGLDTASGKVRNFVAERYDLEGVEAKAENNAVVGYYWSAKIVNAFGIYGKYTGGNTFNGNVNQWTPSCSTLYASYEDMAEAAPDLSGFDAEYWDISSGYPVFKACMEKA